ncbi:MAG: N-methyl-L-tryptophan oxidase [Casimicrobiaceae bacterium]
MTRTAVDMVVIGLGAMGAATCYQLARRGVKVVGIDQFAPPHHYGSSHGETRITRQATGEGTQFVPLARRSQQIWREIEAASGARLFNACGALVIARAAQPNRMHGQDDFLGTTIAAADEFGIAHQRMDASAIAARFPQFVLHGDERGYFEPGAGYLHPEACVAAQLRLALAQGARLVIGHAAVLRRTEGRQTIVECAGVEYVAARVVIAAGAWLPQLLPKLAPRLTVRRQVLYWFALDGSHSYRPDDFPVFIWNWGSGENDLLYGIPQAGDVPEVKVGTEQSRVSTTAETVDRFVSASEIAAVASTRLQGRLRGVTNECRRATTCLYTLTRDSNFIVDWLPDVAGTLVVSACSGHGFKHSAAIGEAVAEMIESGTTPEVLLPFALSHENHRLEMK